MEQREQIRTLRTVGFASLLIASELSFTKIHCIPPYASDYSSRVSILPRRPVRREKWLDAECGDGSGERLAELGVAA
ncbi:MAG: hypothetical protein H6Q31_1830 [Bacteroidetes bacterium]|jgi:hypothetical protein|nr:hypothetical protein [Bacteroidota bacterium]